MKIAIIGGGASGLAAAITAANNGAEVLLLEKNPRVGKKILSTGNGRCNLTNINADAKDYNSDFVKDVLRKFSSTDTVNFFKKLGLLCRAENEGRVYPASFQASAVLDVLRLAAENLSVKQITEFDAVNLKKKKSVFEVTAADGRRITADKVIVTTGGKAAPKTGSDGSGYTLLESFGHTMTERIVPSLTQIMTDRGIKGVRARGRVTLEDGHSDEGEIQFNANAVSGIPVFNISKYAQIGQKLEIDLMPEYSFDELTEILENRPKQTLETFLIGIVNKALGQMILKECGISPLSKNSGDLTEREIKKIASTLKSIKFKITGIMPWENAQVTAGGICTNEFDNRTLQSLIVPGLYAAGEVLDVDAPCGGYNLQWAWASGYVAGGDASCVCN